MEVSKTSDHKDKSKEELIKQDVKNNENDVFTSFNDVSHMKQNYYNNLKLTKNKSTNITDNKIKNTKQEFVNKEVLLNESRKDNYDIFDPKKEDIFKLSEIDESLELGRKEEEEEENNLQNSHNNKFNSKEKSNIGFNNNQTSFKADSFTQKSIRRKSNNLSGVEKTKFYSEKIFTNSKKYFHNLQELISKKINNRKEEKFIKKLNGDTNQVIPFWIDMGIQVDNYDSNNNKSKIDQENNEEKTKENVKCLTYREEATKTLEKFEENLEIGDKNNALSEYNVNEYFIERMEGNLCEINEKVPLKMLKVSNNEGFYEFNNNLNFNSDKGGKGDQPKINNEHIKSEISHQVSQNQYNPSNNNSGNPNFNSKTEDDYLVTKENLSAKGFFRIDTNNTSVIKLPENYWTKDIDKKILVDLINENPTAKWDKIKVDTNIRIYKKKIENNPSILIKTIATINGFSMEEIFNAIANVDIRQKWDTLFSEFKIVEENKEEKSEVLYMSLKSPFMLIERRDFVQRRKIWYDFPDKNSVCIHFKSIDHPLCPLYKKIVRAHTYISGYFIKTESFNPPRCTVHIISQTDVKGKIPVWIVNKVSQTAPNDWVNNLIKGCRMVREKKN